MSNSPPRDRDLVLVISCLVSLTYDTGVKFDATATLDIYVITWTSITRKYIQDIVLRYKGSNVSTMLIYKDFSEFAQVLHILQLIYCEYDDSVQLQKTGGLVMNSSENFVSHTNAPNETKKLPSRRLLVVQDLDDIKASEHLSEKTVGLQQFLRFMLIKFRGSFSVFSGLRLVILNPVEAEFLMELSFEGDKSLQVPIFESKGQKFINEVNVHQSIHSGQDSWSKIELLSKLIHRANKTPMLDSTAALRDLDATISKFLSGKDVECLRRLEFLVSIDEVEDDVDNSKIANEVTYQTMLETCRGMIPQN